MKRKNFKLLKYVIVFMAVFALLGHLLVQPLRQKKLFVLPI